MTIKDHPSFAAQFQRWFIRAWLIDVGLFAGGLYSLKHNHMILGWTLTVGFVGFTLFILAYGYYQLFHVACPDCSGQTTTQKSNSRQVWIAVCTHCNVIWNLKVGIQVND